MAAGGCTKDSLASVGKDSVIDLSTAESFGIKERRGDSLLHNEWEGMVTGSQSQPSKATSLVSSFYLAFLQSIQHRNHLTMSLIT